MKKKGSELEFLSLIGRDGTSIYPARKSFIAMMQNETFKLERLSLSQDTYIAFNMSVFTVKIKKVIDIPK